MRRRTFLQSTILSSVTALAPSAYSSELPKTPRDFEGPFYPVEPRKANNILVRPEAGRSKFAGHYLHFSGEVVTPTGEPIDDAKIDIWHTDPQGRYKHPRDRSKGDRHNDFGYFGLTDVDERGAFEFYTLVPGHYGNRPAHIHYKIWRGDNPVLTSQIYFRQRGGTQGKSKSRTGSAQVVSLDKGIDTDFRIFYQVVV